jgi:hypothetical protein
MSICFAYFDELALALRYEQELVVNERLSKRKNEIKSWK